MTIFFLFFHQTQHIITSLENHKTFSFLQKFERPFSQTVRVSSTGDNVLDLAIADEVWRDVGVHGRAGADEVLVAVHVVDPTHARPQLRVGQDERLKEQKRGF